MNLQQESISWIAGTPLGINVRQVEFIPPHLHHDVLEILFCLSGSINFSYGYETFTLQAGDFVSVDHDVHFLDQGKDAILISFYLDLTCFQEKYPYICDIYFVCEGFCGGKAWNEQSIYYEKLRGILVSILFCFGKEKIETERENLLKGAQKIVDLMVEQFDIRNYYYPFMEVRGELLERYHKIFSYLNQNYEQKITSDSLAKSLHVSAAYLSEFWRKNSIGFRNSLEFIRVSHSEIELLTTNHTIASIAQDCGFSDTKYYYQAFHKWYGCTPRQFRLVYREQLERQAILGEVSPDQMMRLLKEFMVYHYIHTFLAD